MVTQLTPGVLPPTPSLVDIDLFRAEILHEIRSDITTQIAGALRGAFDGLHVQVAAPQVQVAAPEVEVNVPATACDHDDSALVASLGRIESLLQTLVNVLQMPVVTNVTRDGDKLIKSVTASR